MKRTEVEKRIESKEPCFFLEEDYAIIEGVIRKFYSYELVYMKIKGQKKLKEKHIDFIYPTKCSALIKAKKTMREELAYAKRTVEEYNGIISRLEGAVERLEERLKEL